MKKNISFIIILGTLINTSLIAHSETLFKSLQASTVQLFSEVRENVITPQARNHFFNKLDKTMPQITLEGIENALTILHEVVDIELKNNNLVFIDSFPAIESQIARIDEKISCLKNKMKIIIQLNKKSSVVRNKKSNDFVYTLSLVGFLAAYITYSKYWIEGIIIKDKLKFPFIF